LIRDRATPSPALRFDAGRWVGQGAVLVHEGPEVFPDVSVRGVVPHDNIMAANSLNGARNTAKPLSALKSVTCLTGRRSLLTAPGVGGGSGEGELSGGLTSPRAASIVKHT
jgi:hypothetical protein